MGDSDHYDRIVDLITLAQTERDVVKRVDALNKSQELLVHHASHLLDNFLEEILAFLSDSAVEVRKFVLGFIEAACKRDPELLAKVLPNVTYMFASDTNVNVQKRVIVAAANLYALLLKWASTRKVGETEGDLKSLWSEFQTLKKKILPLLDHDNDGIRTHTIKFYEFCILCQSYTSPVMITVARARPQFMESVVVGLETLHVNLPPTLTKSQVSSVRKNLKMHLLTLLKHPDSTHFHAQITTLLTDLGATQMQVLKALPADSELRDRIKRGESLISSDEPLSKKPKPESSLQRTRDEDDEYEEEMGSIREQPEDTEESRRSRAIEVTAEYLHSMLNVDNVADLVLLCMMMLPDGMPPTFQSSYTPIAAAGTEAQIRHLSRLMATQFTAAGVGPGAEQIKHQRARTSPGKTEFPQSTASTASAGKATTSMPDMSKPPPEILAAAKASANSTADSVGSVPGAKEYGAAAPTGAKQTAAEALSGAKRMQQLGLVAVTTPLDPQELERMTDAAVGRLFESERRALQGGANLALQRLLVRLVTRLSLGESAERRLRAFIIAEQKARADLALAWIHDQFAVFKNMNKGVVDPDGEVQQAYDNYDTCLCRLLNDLFKKGDHKESLFHKILEEAPLITPNATIILKQACMDSTYGSFGMNTLRQMILTRPKQRPELLAALVDFTVFERLETRTHALDLSKELYQMNFVKPVLRNLVVMQAQYLLESGPPPSMFGADRGRIEPRATWDESTVRACLGLLMHLMPVDGSLVADLSKIYVRTENTVKRLVLKYIEAPVKNLGMKSPELLALVENCPSGAEALVTKIVHVLTERSPPSEQLVARVRDLYRYRMSDVRILIPVLTGLSKTEIVTELGKFVRLNPNVVKEVFNRLLFAKSASGQAPMTATELLVHLNQLNVERADDMKAVSSAMNQLLGMRQVYTKEVVAGAVQQLLDFNPLPPLLMRTVILALQMYPVLSGFIMNVLQRLIVKQVWLQPRLWDGFVICCLRARPQSYSVLLQLPAEQLSLVFRQRAGAGAREELLDYVAQLSQQQLALIPQATLLVLASDPNKDSGSQPTENQPEPSQIGDAGSEPSRSIDDPQQPFVVKTEPDAEMGTNTATGGDTDVQTVQPQTVSLVSPNSAGVQGGPIPNVHLDS